MGQGNPPTHAAELRALPAVHELAAALEGPRELAVAAARRAIDERRAAVRARGTAADPRLTDPPLTEPPVTDPRLTDPPVTDPPLIERAREILNRLSRPSLRRVINATGVIIHTNLGRAPLPGVARGAVAEAAEGYGNLELALDTGARGSRQDHVEGLLRELTGAQAAMVVNNGAAAVLLAASALAGPGRGIAVSRGQLVEIGGGFRIPEVIAQSGSVMVEVGTTNRTRLSDYKRGLERAEVILRVHPSNFRTIGFVEEVGIEALCQLPAPVIDDVGSGVLADAAGIPALADEPAVNRSVAAGAALVCCSGDKLLGGPQAGLLVGRAEAVAAARVHPLARALRIDKLSLAALEATLSLYREPARARREIPVLAMLEASPEALTRRAELLRDAVGPGAEIVNSTARVGGGALPLLELRGPAVALDSAIDPAALMATLRAADPPVIARIHDGRVLLDPRTLRDDELQQVAAAARAAVSP